MRHLITPVAALGIVLFATAPVSAQANAAAWHDATPSSPTLAAVAHLGESWPGYGVLGGQLEWRVAPWAALVADASWFGLVFECVGFIKPALPLLSSPDSGCHTTGWIFGGGARFNLTPGAVEPYLSVLAGYAGGESYHSGFWNRLAVGFDRSLAGILGLRLEGRLDMVPGEWGALGVGVGLRASP